MCIRDSRGSIEVRGANHANDGDTETYAIDRNTIAFYYNGDDYAVATGWQNMEDVYKRQGGTVSIHDPGSL